MSKRKWPEQEQMRKDLVDFVSRRKTQRQAAREFECSEVMLSEILLGKRPIPRSVARVLGYHKVVLWKKN